MVIGREVDGGEGDIAEEAGGSTFVKPDETEVLDNPHGGAARDAFNSFSDLALHLKPDLDDFQGVGENLWNVSTV